MAVHAITAATATVTGDTEVEEEEEETARAVEGGRLAAPHPGSAKTPEDAEADAKATAPEVPIAGSVSEPISCISCDGSGSVKGYGICPLCDGRGVADDDDEEDPAAATEPSPGPAASTGAAMGSAIEATRSPVKSSLAYLLSPGSR